MPMSCDEMTRWRSGSDGKGSKPESNQVEPLDTPTRCSRRSVRRRVVEQSTSALCSGASKLERVVEAGKGSDVKIKTSWRAATSSNSSSSSSFSFIAWWTRRQYQRGQQARPTLLLRRALSWTLSSRGCVSVPDDDDPRRRATSFGGHGRGCSLAPSRPLCEPPPTPSS